MSERLTVNEDSIGKRLDVFLSEVLPSVSRSQLQKAVKDGLVLLNGRKTKPHTFLRAGDEVTYDPEAAEPPAPFVLQPRPDLPVEVVHEDEDIVVIDKRSGMIVHPSPMGEQDTLANALLGRYPDIAGVGEGPERPGIMQRLDRDASGLMVIARNDDAYRKLKKQFQKHDITKEYLVLAQNEPPEDEGTITLAIGRAAREQRMAARSRPRPGDREAITHYTVIERFRDATLLKVRTETGRTHQIRAHLRALGCPVAGDRLYGPKKGGPRLPVGRLFLHAAKLGFRHPRTNEWVEFEAPLPLNLETSLTDLRRKSG